MENKRRRILKPISVAVLCTAVFTTMLSFGETKPDADSMNNASIIIGTYLFDFEALNEENQSLAEKNAQDTSQNKVYYKSELNNGVWYDITNAENVNDIVLSNNKIVDAKVINSLELTKYFKADGTIVDFTTGQVISSVDIDSVVYPVNLSSMSSLTNQLDITEGLIKSTEEDEDKEEMHDNYVAEKDALDYILAPVSDDVTSDLTKKLNALENAMISMNGAAGDTIAEEKLNLRNELEKHCSEVVAKRIDEKVDSLSKRDKAAHAELISMLTDCQSSLNESINELNSAAGSSSDSITQKKADSLSEELVDAALNGNLGAIVKAADRLDVLNAIIDGAAVDSEKAAEMSKELFEDALAGIEEDVGSVLNRTNDYYSEDNKQSAAEVAGKLEIAINEAKGFAQSAAAFAANSTSSEKFNSMKAESLNQLGKLLEALTSQDGTSGSQNSSDPLYKAFMETLADNADEILSDAANAAALADSELSSDKQNIDNLKAQIDSAYEKYIEALADGDGENAEKYSEKLSELTDALSDARRESTEKIKDSIGGLLADKSNALDPNADKKKAEDDARNKLAEINALKDLQSDTDAALIEQLCDALESFDNAAESGNLSDAEDAYNDLKDSLANLPDVFLDNEDKAAAVAYAAEKLDDCGIDALNDRLKEDVTAALDGTLSPTEGGINGADSGTDGPQDSGFLPSTLDELTQYKLVIPEFDIYSNDMSVEQEGVVFVSAERLAEAAGAQFIRAEDVIVIKDENVLIEFKAEDSTAYINDKMFALAKAPFLLNGETYIPVELITAGYGLSEVQEENTTILR